MQKKKSKKEDVQVGGGDLGESMHPRQIEQIPPFKSPSLPVLSPPTPLPKSSAARLALGKNRPSFLLFLHLLLFCPLFLHPPLASSSSPLSFVLTPQRFRSPIVPSTFEICRETDKRKKDRRLG